MSDRKVYEKLIEWLRSGFMEVPEADDLLPMIQARFTSEEAELLTGVPLSSPFPRPTLEELAAQKGMDPAELAPRLDAIAKYLLAHQRSESRRPLVIGFRTLSPRA